MHRIKISAKPKKVIRSSGKAKKEDFFIFVLLDFT